MEELSSKFRILANISEKLPNNKKPILVGGSAVEFYTLGTCKSIDIEIVGESVEGRRVNEILHEGKPIRVISIEDLIVDRLNACKHWKSHYDCEQAQVLVGVYSEKLDREYLKKRMKEEDLELELIALNPES